LFRRTSRRFSAQSVAQFQSDFGKLACLFRTDCVLNDIVNGAPGRANLIEQVTALFRQSERVAANVVATCA